jgi:hypothetical protein
VIQTVPTIAIVNMPITTRYIQRSIVNSYL